MIKTERVGDLNGSAAVARTVGVLEVKQDLASAGQIVCSGWVLPRTLVRLRGQ